MAIAGTGFLLAAASGAARGATWWSVACLAVGIACGAIAAVASWRRLLRS